MNKLFTKIATAFVGIAMAIGVGVAVGNNRAVTPAYSAPGANPMTSIFSTAKWGVSSGDSWVSDNDGYQMSSGNGVQVTSAYSGAGCTSTETYSNITKITVNAKTTSKGVGNITAKVGSGSAQTICSLSKSSTASDYSLNYDTAVSGKVTIVVNCSTNSMYLSSVTITYSGEAPTTTYTVTYAANDGTSTTKADPKSPYASGATVTVLENEFEREGYDFVDFNTSADGTGTSYDADDTFTINANTTLYAQWEEQGGGDYENVYSTGFENSEGFEASTSYNTEKDNQGPSGKQWKFYYGTASTNEAIDGSQSLQMRWYGNASGNIPYAQTKFGSANISRITFKYKTGSTDVGFKIQKSANGSTWTDIDTVSPEGLTVTDYSKVLDSPISTFYFRIILNGTAPGSGNTKFIIDNVSFDEVATTDAKVIIDGTETELSVSEKENVPVNKTLVLKNVTMAELSYSFDDTKMSVVADNANSKITITGTKDGGPYDIEIKKSEDVLFTIHFTIIANNTVTVTAGSSTVQEEKTLQLSASSSKGSDTFTWGTSDETIATVNSTGLVTGVSVGTVTITASSNNWSGTEGSINIQVTFGGSYSRANWYNPETLDNDQAGTDATSEGVKNAFSGNAITISSVSVTGTVKDGKYGGLSFGSSSKNGSITIEMKSGYYLKSITLWGSVVDSGTIPNVSGNSEMTLMNNRGSMVSRSQPMGDLPLTWTFATASSSLTISGGGASSPKARFTIYQLDLVFTDIEPTSISLGGDTSVTMMRTETKTLLPTVLPRNYNVDLGISWSTDDEEVATVLSSTITAVDVGTANITGSSTYGNVVCAVTVIPLTASSINIRGETVASLVGTGAEELEISGKTWSTNKTRQQSLDITNGSEIAGYTKYCVKIGDAANSGGSIGNQDPYMFKFKKVIVAYCLDADGSSPYLGGSQTITVSGSETFGEVDVSTTSGTTSGLIETFTLSTACTYISISTAGNRFVSSVTFVFDTPEETEFSAAEYILGLSPDRGNEVIGSCNIENGTYIAAKRFLNAAGSTVIEKFQTSQDATVVRARERYTIWAKNNGDSAGLYDGTENMTASRLILLDNIFNSAGTSLGVIVISLVSAVSVGGYFFLRKKKED